MTPSIELLAGGFAVLAALYGLFVLVLFWRRRHSLRAALETRPAPLQERPPPRNQMQRLYEVYDGQHRLAYIGHNFDKALAASDRLEAEGQLVTLHVDQRPVRKLPVPPDKKRSWISRLFG